MGRFVCQKTVFWRRSCETFGLAKLPINTGITRCLQNFRRHKLTRKIKKREGFHEIATGLTPSLWNSEETWLPTPRGWYWWLAIGTCRITVNRYMFAISLLKSIVFLNMGTLKCDTVARYFWKCRYCEVFLRVRTWKCDTVARHVKKCALRVEETPTEPRRGVAIGALAETL